MPATSVIGLQWGDEAKGKIVDLLTEDHDIVVGYQGGNNAGHTVQFDGQTYKLSLLPAGILRPGVESVVTGGVVINPRAFLEELDGIVGLNGGVARNLLISNRAHVVFPGTWPRKPCLKKGAVVMRSARRCEGSARVIVTRRDGPMRFAWATWSAASHFETGSRLLSGTRTACCRHSIPSLNRSMPKRSTASTASMRRGWHRL
ncbi:MAG: hypothetical protein CM1200mP2_40170 [Planctomycetaceae bacterium]|nr:MAG: hypothetical protein CM1200mP2_40170 [Planctomycetaceae bacterium]